MALITITPNKISYDGFFVQKDFLEEIGQEINKVISKLRIIIEERL